MEDFEYLKERATLIGKLGARARGTPSEIKRGDQTLEDVFVSGATAAIADIENRDIADGRFIVQTEDDAAQRVAYIGADVATKLFPVGSPLSQEISIRGLPYRVIGVEVARGTVVTDFKWRVYPMGRGPAFHGVGSGVYIRRGGRWVEVLEHETVVKVDEGLAPGKK